MVTFVIILWVAGMLMLPLGRIYMIWQQHRGNPKFKDPRFVKKYDAIRRIGSIVVTAVALLILLILEHQA